jgi:DNA invertase Pin-like site-specific DNA recombinase
MTCNAIAPGAIEISMDWHSSSKIPLASKTRPDGARSETERKTNDSKVAQTNQRLVRRGGRSVGYARVSTEGQSLDQQLVVLREAGSEEVFGEKVSRTVPAHKRQQLQAALASLQKGDTLILSKLDRLGRTQSEVVAGLAELQQRGVFIRTLDGLLNTAALGKMAPLIVGLLTGLSEVERSLIQERTRESVEHRRRTGGKLGGRPPLTEGSRELVRWLRDEGKSYRDVTEICGISVATAHRYGKQA